MTAPERLFGVDECQLLDDLQPLCEELVGDHFRITSFNSQTKGYEVVTLEAGGDECRESTALAKLCRYDRRERPIGGHPRRVTRFYRVCLQDDNLLARVDQGLELRALLLYVLTHELIHIVRFESFAVSYNATGALREAEEGLVDRLTRELLEPLAEPGLPGVFDALSAGRVDVLFAQE